MSNAGAAYSHDGDVAAEQGVWDSGKGRYAAGEQILAVDVRHKHVAPYKSGKGVRRKPWRPERR